MIALFPEVKTATSEHSSTREAGAGVGIYSFPSCLSLHGCFMFPSFLFNRKEVILCVKDKDDPLGPGLAIILPNTIPAYSTSFALPSQILLLTHIFLNLACEPMLQVSPAVTFSVLQILHTLHNATDCVTKCLTYCFSLLLSSSKTNKY